MTVTDDQIRTALDHRLRAAGLDDPDAIPAPRKAELRLMAAPPPSHRGRVLAVAAVLVLLAAGAALVARHAGGTRAETVPATASTSVPLTTPEPAGGVALPPPWPALDLRPATKLDLGGDPIDSEEEFLERLPELDRQGQEADHRAGRLNVVDQVTGELVNVDQEAYNAQFSEVSAWYREHLGGLGDAAIGELDPTIVFTDGSFRIVHRADLDCSPLPDGRTRPACTRFDREGREGQEGQDPRSGGD